MTETPAPEPLPAAPIAPASEDEPTAALDFTADRKFQLYLQQRKDYSDGARDAYQRFDQAIVALSGGSIVLSISFLKDIGHTPESLPWLFRSWGCFLVASLCAFISLLTSGEFQRKQVQELDCLMTTGECKEPRVLSWITARLNYVALFFCIVGVALLIFFSRLNLAEWSDSKWQKAANPTAPANSAPATVSSVQGNQSTRSLSPGVSSAAAAPAATAAPRAVNSATQTQPIPATQSQRP